MPATILAPVAGGAADGRAALERLWQLYAHDMSEFRGALPGEDGLYRADRPAQYLCEPDRCAYLIRHDDRPAGFVMVRGLGSGLRVMGEFFVVRAVRRRRVGHEAATTVIRHHPGPWEIPFQDENPGAARFWRRVAGDLVGDTWTEDRRPVPGKPHVPPDVWLRLTV